MPPRQSVLPESSAQQTGGRPSSDPRPTKRSRHIPPMEDTDPATDDATPAVPLSRSARGPAACERCRDRKTKCDFQRPVCGYCAKRNLPCVYANERSDLAVTGADILAAIGDLSKLVESQQAARIDCTPSCSAHRTLHDISSPVSQRPAQTPSARSGWAGENTAVGASTGTQGLDAILQWDVFQFLRPIPCLFSEEVQRPLQVLPPPILQYSELLRLENKYIDGIHNKNPFLDLAELHAMILNVAENGPDWSTQTCLVALVCAVGAITQSYPTNNVQPMALRYSTVTSPPDPVVENGDLRLAHQFWGIAAKRLGLAIGQNDVASVQCLCLAGIWYMHNLQPLQAWKHFNLAGSSWHCLRLMNRAPGDLFDTGHDSSKSFTVSQSLYFTIWKSQCELMLELPLPSPEFDSVRFPHTFPTPPTPSADFVGTDAGEDERCWYYYLAEIAARHLLNRLVQTNVDTSGPVTMANIQRLITEAELMENQIFNWYSSLPSIFYFDIPRGFSLDPHADDMTQILRHRYLSLRDIVARPFVRLCVEHSLDNLDYSLRARVLSLATQSLQYCMLKLSQVKPHRHQGIWFGLRNATSASLVLCAVHLAQQKPWTVGAHALVLPAGWRARISEAHQQTGAFWYEPNGGATAIQNVLQSSLDACLGESQPES